MDYKSMDYKSSFRQFMDLIPHSSGKHKGQSGLWFPREHDVVDLALGTSTDFEHFVDINKMVRNFAREGPAY